MIQQRWIALEIMHVKLTRIELIPTHAYSHPKAKDSDGMFGLRVVVVTRLGYVNDLAGSRGEEEAKTKFSNTKGALLRDLKIQTDRKKNEKKMSMVKRKDAKASLAFSFLQGPPTNLDPQSRL